MVNPEKIKIINKKDLMSFYGLLWFYSFLIIFGPGSQISANRECSRKYGVPSKVKAPKKHRNNQIQYLRT